MIYPLLAVSAIVPSLLLLWYFNKSDAFPEPPRVVWATFGFGVLTIVPVLTFALPMGKLVQFLPGQYAEALYTAFVLAAIPEEFFKFTVVLFYASRHKEFDELMDGFVYGVAASLGFATLENILYVSQGGLMVALLRSVTAVPCHTLLGAMMGFLIAHWRLVPNRRGRTLFAAWFFPMLLHGIYDFPILLLKGFQSTGGEAGLHALWMILVPIMLITCWLWVRKRMRRLGKAQRWMASELEAIGELVVSRPAGGAAPRWRSILSIVLGGILASIGGVFTLGILLGLALGHTDPSEVKNVVMGGVLVGVLPLIIGIFLFRGGLRGLNKGGAKYAKNAP